MIYFYGSWEEYLPHRNAYVVGAKCDCGNKHIRTFSIDPIELDYARIDIFPRLKEKIEQEFYCQQ